MGKGWRNIFLLKKLPRVYIPCGGFFYIYSKRKEVIKNSWALLYGLNPKREGAKMGKNFAVICMAVVFLRGVRVMVKFGWSK